MMGPSSILSRVARFPSQPAGLPVAPGWLPFVGHLPQLIRDLPQVMRGCDRAGPLCWLDLGGKRRQLLSTREEAFTVFRNRETSSKNLARDAGALLMSSLLVLDGPPHRRSRGAMAAPFTPRGLNASKAGALIREVVEPRVRAWANRSEVALTEETREFAVDVIFRMMGIPTSELAAWRHQFEEIIFLVFGFDWDFPGSPRRRGQRAQRWIDARLARYIAEARGRAPEADLVAAMVHGRDEQGRGLDHDELLANLRILVFAGHETTASVMAWMVLELAKHPDLWRRAVDEALAADGPPTTASELERFPFMESVFRETLRLHPPVVLDSRETETELDLLGVKIPPGVTVGCSVYGISRNPERYPEPDRFHPDRWATLAHKPGALETAQFGGGPHFCLGYHMALLEAVQFGVTLARTLGERNLGPILLDGALPKPVWFPVSRPPAGTRVRIGRVGAT
ncbi:cytochrome P450 [Polyangium aurulentum]|uniref:cytochrome P450 n=1 Tax=Polyangium aurulentum TaxID=2567896 RepID=UPI00146B27FF|nr:cytochrome P450 [Polyangium aurulentum]UQA55980.1 cytochrome P450 [Polyangium aurulentum]